MTLDAKTPGRAEIFADAELTQDAFLGGRFTLLQPRKGYRAGIDPVFLAAAVCAKQGESVLELGCGGGAASLCLGVRCPGLSLTGIEVQPAYADLARRNAELAGIRLRVECCNISMLPKHLKAEQFDHVMANPPYFPEGVRTQAQDLGRETGLQEHVPLATWISVAAKRLKPNGIVTVIQNAARLPDILRALPSELGSVDVQPIASRTGRTSKLILLRAKKGGRAEFRLQSQVVIHDGLRHTEKTKDYNPLIEAVLRDGADFPWGRAA